MNVLKKQELLFTVLGLFTRSRKHFLIVRFAEGI
jgi:hypothetical protein